MANDDQKEPEGGTGPGLGGTKLDRRDMLMGLSTVPALGLFGYAWKQAARVRAGAAGGDGRRRGGPGHRRSRDQRGPSRRGGPGAGAPRRHAPDPRAPLPGGVRHLGRSTTRSGWSASSRSTSFDVNGYDRSPRDARQGEGPRRGHHRHARTSGTPSTPSTASRPASTCTARRRCRTPSRAPAAWWRRPARPASCSRSGTSGAATRGTSTATTSSCRKRSCSAGS